MQESSVKLVWWVLYFRLLCWVSLCVCPSISHTHTHSLTHSLTFSLLLLSFRLSTTKPKTDRQGQQERKVIQERWLWLHCGGNLFLRQKKMKKKNSWAFQPPPPFPTFHITQLESLRKQAAAHSIVIDESAAVNFTPPVDRSSSDDDLLPELNSTDVVDASSSSSVVAKFSPGKAKGAKSSSRKAKSLSSGDAMAMTMADYGAQESFVAQEKSERSEKFKKKDKRNRKWKEEEEENMCECVGSYECKRNFDNKEWNRNLLFLAWCGGGKYAY